MGNSLTNISFQWQFSHSFNHCFASLPISKGTDPEVVANRKWQSRRKQDPIVLGMEKVWSSALPLGSGQQPGHRTEKCGCCFLAWCTVTVDTSFNIEMRAKIRQERKVHQNHVPSHQLYCNLGLWNLVNLCLICFSHQQKQRLS